MCTVFFWKPCHLSQFCSDYRDQNRTETGESSSRAKHQREQVGLLNNSFKLLWLTPKKQINLSLLNCFLKGSAPRDPAPFKEPSLPSLLNTSRARHWPSQQIRQQRLLFISAAAEMPPKIQKIIINLNTSEWLCGAVSEMFQSFLWAAGSHQCTDKGLAVKCCVTGAQLFTCNYEMTKRCAGKFRNVTTHPMLQKS